MYFISGDEPAHGTMLERWSDSQLQQHSQFAAVGDNERADANLHLIRSVRRGQSRRTTVNQLMPLELCWLDVPGPAAPVVPAARW